MVDTLSSPSVRTLQESASVGLSNFLQFNNEDDRILDQAHLRDS